MNKLQKLRKNSKKWVTFDMKNNVLLIVVDSLRADKFYNQNSVPLVEVIHDTVCRHDTFGLACNAKYYEDRGFPGHISCTDNFNSSLAEFGVAPRRNWAAVNLFFNTAIEECHSLSSDVSWSRPGDYVL